MAPTPEPDESTTLSPDEAFATLGDETRLAILQALGAADGPLSFSELFDRIDYDTPGNFSYHLGKLEGHFVRKTEEGYSLRQAGRRVVEAVLSGAVTDDLVVERSTVDVPCFLCGNPVEVSYRQENVGIFCPACGGTRSGASSTADWADDPATDIVGHVTLPPAGIRDRTPAELLYAAEVWTVTESLATARGVCPRCSARIEHSLKVCSDHDTSDGLCSRCDQQFGVTIHVDCTNCVLELESVFTKHLLANPDLMAFMIEHDVDPIAPEGFHLAALEEDIVSTDPFEARFTFAVEGDSITLTVGEGLEVVNVSRNRSSKRREIPE